MNSGLAPASSAILENESLVALKFHISESNKSFDLCNISALNPIAKSSSLSQNLLPVNSLLYPFIICCGTPCAFSAVANSDSLTTDQGSSIFINENTKAISQAALSAAAPCFTLSNCALIS
jgi:hypothetical protein